MNKRITWTITYNVDRHETGTYISEEITYDVRGNVLDQTRFDQSGRALHRVVFRYSDVSGNLVEQVEYDSLNGLIERKEFLENANGEVYKAVITYNDGSSETREYAFSDLGKADRAIVHDETGTRTGEEIFAYDDEDNLILEIEKDADGTEVLRIERDYSPGALLKAKRIFVNGEIQESTTFGYNAYGSRVIRIKKNRSGTIVESEVTSYTDQNVPVERRLESNSGSVGIVEESIFDETGNIVLVESRKGGQLIFRNACAYDEDHLLISEELLELTSGGKVLRHEKLEHHWEGNPLPREENQKGLEDSYGEW